MNQQCSILRLIIFILVSAENALTVLNNVLPSKPIKAEQSILKTKAIFLNNGFAKIDPNVYNYNNDKRLDVFDVSKTNNIYVVPIGTKSVTRFPRQVQKLSYDKNNNEDISRQHIELLLDLQSENQKDVYDYYDDYRSKNIDALIDDCKLNNEMENNSKLVTKTLSESQKRKRCTTIMTQTLGAKSRQESQELPSENVEDENNSALKCKDCKFSKSNDNSSELIRNFNSQINEMNDDYLIIILKQLIDKLNKTDKLKSIFYEDIPVQRSNGPAAPLEDQTVRTKNANSSSKEEWILKLEKTKGSQILDELDSGLENTLINRKWMKSKITKNKSNDCSKLTIINDLRSDLNDKNESVLNSDVKPLDLKSSENHVIYTDGNISKNSNRLQMIVNTQENKEVTTAPLSEESDRLFESRRTVSPSYLSSIPAKYVYDFTTIDGNNEDRDTNEDNFEPTSDLNSALRIKDTDEISEPYVDINDNSPKTNSSEGTDSSSVEKEHGSSGNNANNCGRDKKFIKNVLSSKLIKNATEINIDTYALPNNRTKSHRRLDRSQKENGEKDNSKNASGETIALKTDNDLKWKTGISRKNNINEPKTRNTLREFVLVNNDDDRSPNGKYDHRRRNIMKAKAAIPDWERFKLASRRKHNHDGNDIDNEVDGKQSSTTISTAQNDPRRFAEKLKRPRTTDTGDGNDIGKHNNVDRMAADERIACVAKSRNRTAPEKSRERTVVHYDGNSSKYNRRTSDTKSKHAVPTNRGDTQTAGRYGEHGNNNAGDVTRRVASRSKSLSRVTTDIDKSHEVIFDGEDDGHCSRENGVGRDDSDAAVRLRRPWRNSSRSVAHGDGTRTIPKSTRRYGRYDGEPFVRNVSTTKRPRPTESGVTADGGIVVSTLGWKKSSDRVRKTIGSSRPLNERPYASTTGCYHRDDRSTTGAGFVVVSGRKRDFRPERVVPSQSKPPKPCSADHAPYTVEDLRPIASGSGSKRAAIRAERGERPDGSNEDYGKPGGRAAFQALRRVKIVDGVFNVVSCVDRDGSVLIPIEAVSLAKLLTGDFRLSDDGRVVGRDAQLEEPRFQLDKVHITQHFDY